MNNSYIPKPGETILDILIDSFAKNIALPVNDIEKLISGDLKIDANLATKLANALGPTQEFWLRLQVLYNLNLLREEFRDLISKHIETNKYASYVLDIVDRVISGAISFNDDSISIEWIALNDFRVCANISDEGWDWFAIVDGKIIDSNEEYYKELPDEFFVYINKIKEMYIDRGVKKILENK